MAKQGRKNKVLKSHTDLTGSNKVPTLEKCRLDKRPPSVEYLLIFSMHGEPKTGSGCIQGSKNLALHTSIGATKTWFIMHA